MDRQNHKTNHVQHLSCELLFRTLLRAGDCLQVWVSVIARLHRPFHGQPDPPSRTVAADRPHPARSLCRQAVGT